MMTHNSESLEKRIKYILDTRHTIPVGGRYPYEKDVVKMVEIEIAKRELEANQSMLDMMERVVEKAELKSYIAELVNEVIGEDQAIYDTEDNYLLYAVGRNNLRAEQRNKLKKKLEEGNYGG